MAELIRDYLIKIIGKQFVDGEEDVMEVETTGHYEEKDGIKYIHYKEYVEDDNGEGERDTLVKIEGDNLITIIRKGEHQSQLMLELDRQHQCYYQTPFGDIIIRVYTSVMKIDVDDSGGKVQAVYSLNFNGDFGSENEFLIEFKKLGHI